MTSYVLIVSPARSGSTSLRETLDRHPSILCHGEILGQNRILGASHKIKAAEITVMDRRLDRPKFLSTFLDREDFATTGFKALYEHFFVSANAYYLNWILSQHPKVIFLWRRNLVKRFKSECRLRVQAGVLKMEVLQKMTGDDLVADAKLQMEMAGWISQILSTHGLNPGENILDVNFEDLISDPGVVPQILQFLDVDAPDAELGKDKRTAHSASQKEELLFPDAFESFANSSYSDVRLEDARAWFSTLAGCAPPPCEPPSHPLD